MASSLIAGLCLGYCTMAPCAPVARAQQASPAEAPALHALLVDLAAGEPRDSRRLAIGDTEALGSFLASEGYGVKTLVKPRRPEILSQLARVAQSLRPEDAAVLVFSGLVLRHEVTGDYFFLSSEAEDGLVDEVGIQLDHLMAYLRAVPATRKVVLFDLTFGGSALKHETRGWLATTVRAFLEKPDSISRPPPVPARSFRELFADIVSQDAAQAVLGCVRQLGDARQPAVGSLILNALQTPVSDLDGDGVLSVSELFELLDRELGAAAQPGALDCSFTTHIDMDLARLAITPEDSIAKYLETLKRWRGRGWIELETYLKSSSLIDKWRQSLDSDTPLNRADSHRVDQLIGLLASGGPEQERAQILDDLMPARYALLVGVSDPSGFSFEGVDNDLELMRQLLHEDFAFDRVDVLSGAKARRTAILGAIAELTSLLRRGSKLVLYFSGRGIEIRDEAKGVVGAFVAADPESSAATIRNDLLDSLLREHAAGGSDITVILDTAYVSGFDSPAYSVMACCREDEAGNEYPAPDGQVYGAFTWLLAHAVRELGITATYREILKQVNSRAETMNIDQRATFYGSGLHRSLFSSQVLAERTPYLLANQAADGTVSLDAGTLHGVTRGSIYEIYPSSTFRFAAARPTATVKVDNVSETRSSARIVEGDKIKALSRAVEIERFIPDPAMAVFFEGIDRSEGLRELRAAVAGYGNILVTDDEAAADVLVSEQDDLMVLRGRGAARAGASDNLPIRLRSFPTELPDEAAGSITWAAGQLAGWARWHGLREIRNPRARLDVEFSVRKSSARGTRALPTRCDAREGEALILEVTNYSAQAMYLALFSLSADGRTQLLFPAGEQAELLGARETWQHEIEAQLPPERSSITIVLKLFVTTEPADFRGLTDPEARSRRGPDSEPLSPLEELLATASLGTPRGPEKTTRIDNWATAEQTLQICGVW